MTLLKAVILGLIQGATEFLPVSSSGHLVLMQYYLKTPEASLAFDVLLHLATVVAVLVYFWRDLLTLLRQPRIIGLLLLGSVPAGLAGVLFKKSLEKLFVESVSTVAVELMVTGLILWAAEELAAGRRNKRKRGLAELTAMDALVAGTGQAVAIIPGISRSGATIGAALAMGVEREDAAKFSFFLSVPAILGAGLLEAHDIMVSGIGLSWVMLAGGFIAALVAGLLAIGVLLSVLKCYSLKIFSIYLWLLGGIVLVARLF